MKASYIAVLALAVAVGFASGAMASEYNFSFSGGGITASGTLIVSQTSTAGVDDIIGITGTFSDTNAGAVVSGAITGLYKPLSYVSNTLATPGVASTTTGLSYDDTFYPAANSPLVCYDLVDGVPTLTYPFSGGVFDIFGVTFDVAGGYVGELWSNGYLPDSNGTMPGAPGYVNNLVYAAALSNATTLLDDPNAAGTTIPPGEFGTLTTYPSPESGSLVLFGIGLLGIAALWARKFNELRSPRM